MQHSRLIKEYANNLRTLFGRSPSRPTDRDQSGLDRKIRILRCNFDTRHFLQVEPSFQTPRRVARTPTCYCFSHSNIAQLY